MIKELQLYAPVLQKAVLGEYTYASQMKDDLLHMMWKKKTNKKRLNSVNYFTQAVIISLISGLYYVISSLLF